MVAKINISGYKEVRFKCSKLLFDRLKSCSKKSGETMSTICRKAIRDYINSYDESKLTF